MKIFFLGLTFEMETERDYLIANAFVSSGCFLM